MSYFPRLLLAVAAPVLLTHCGLINAALRLAPMAMMLAEEGATSGSGDTDSYSKRGKMIEARGNFAPPILPADTVGSGLAHR
jgi:hypothetical protein